MKTIKYLVGVGYIVDGAQCHVAIEDSLDAVFESAFIDANMEGHIEITGDEILVNCWTVDEGEPSKTFSYTVLNNLKSIARFLEDFSEEHADGDERDAYWLSRLEIEDNQLTVTRH